MNLYECNITTIDGLTGTLETYRGQVLLPGSALPPQSGEVHSHVGASPTNKFMLRPERPSSDC